MHPGAPAGQPRRKICNNLAIPRNNPHKFGGRSALTAAKACTYRVHLISLYEQGGWWPSLEPPTSTALFLIFENAVGLDVDACAREFGGEARILALFADGK
jgi:hypothetical protein